MKRFELNGFHGDDSFDEIMAEVAADRDDRGGPFPGWMCEVHDLAGCWDNAPNRRENLRRLAEDVYDYRQAAQFVENLLREALKNDATDA
jgi:hypothetical protein